jgi:hypothetical protein
MKMFLPGLFVATLTFLKDRHINTHEYTLCTDVARDQTCHQYAAFYEAFDVKSTDPMFIPDSLHVKIR